MVKRVNNKKINSVGLTVCQEWHNVKNRQSVFFFFNLSLIKQKKEENAPIRHNPHAKSFLMHMPPSTCAAHFLPHAAPPQPHLQLTTSLLITDYRVLLGPLTPTRVQLLLPCSFLETHSIFNIWPSGDNWAEEDELHASGAAERTECNLSGRQ